MPKKIEVWFPVAGERCHEGKFKREAGMVPWGIAKIAYQNYIDFCRSVSSPFQHVTMEEFATNGVTWSELANLLARRGSLSPLVPLVPLVTLVPFDPATTVGLVEWMFPMQAERRVPGPPDNRNERKPGEIPWQIANEAYKNYARMYGTSQSLKRLAERGGFGWSEFAWLMRSDTGHPEFEAVPFAEPSQEIIT